MCINLRLPFFKPGVKWIEPITSDGELLTGVVSEYDFIDLNIYIYITRVNFFMSVFIIFPL